MAHRTQTGQTPNSMDDALRRAKAAAAAMDQQRAHINKHRVFHDSVRTPDHPHVKLVRRGAIAAVIIGALMVAFLPDGLGLHMLGFAGMLTFFFIVVPNFLLREDGTLSLSRLVGCGALILLLGAMTATAVGPTGNLWSWSPWANQFYATPSAAQPHH